MSHLTSIGEKESEECACVLESYVRDEIDKGIFAFLELFSDDSIMSEKLDVNIF